MNFPDNFLVRLRSIRVIFVYLFNLDVPDPYPLLCDYPHLVFFAHHVCDLNLQVLHYLTQLIPYPSSDLFYKLLFLLTYPLIPQTTHSISHISLTVFIYLNVMRE